jgi:hypothetical protein
VFSVSGHILGQEFEGDESVEASIFGFIDDPHPAAAQPFEDAVMRNGLTYELEAGSHWREC